MSFRRPLLIFTILMVFLISYEGYKITRHVDQRELYQLNLRDYLPLFIVDNATTNVTTNVTLTSTTLGHTSDDKVFSTNQSLVFHNITTQEIVKEDGVSPKSLNESAADNTTLSPVDGITAIHPASKEHLWLEIDNKFTLIRRTAFFDNRFGSAVVVVSLHNIKRRKLIPKLFAKVVMPNGAEWCQETETVINVPNGPFPRKDFRHGPDEYICNIKRIVVPQNQIPPKYISLSTSQTCKNLLPPMPIYYEKREERVKFAVCLHKGIFGYVSPQLLIHFVEMNRVLGASIITIWIQDASDSVYTAMLPYIQSGLVELIDWKVSVAMRNYGQFAVNNECLYRNIHRAEYMILHDIDELLIPYLHDTWFEMLEYIDKMANLSSYATVHVESVPWKIGDKSIEIPEDLKCSKMELPFYFKWSYRLKEIDTGRPKLIVSLDRSIAVYTHSVKKWIEGVERQYFLPANISCFHHYRIPPLKGNYVFDPFMERFVNRTMPGIKEYVC